MQQRCAGENRAISALEVAGREAYKYLDVRLLGAEVRTMANPSPVVGDWYRRTSGDSFEVVAIDPDDRTIEIQYFDGTIEEVELEQWLEDTIERASAPEDWTGSVDIEPEDYENEVEAEPGSGSSTYDPLAYLDRSEAQGFSEMEWPEDDAERP
jgi:hypothetical protein